MHVLYYASMLRCWHLIWILVRTNYPCLGWDVTGSTPKGPAIDIWLNLVLGDTYHGATAVNTTTTSKASFAKKYF
jgi:hypothetical protein